MALQGTLDTFALPDVLRLLAATTKTGRLQISGDRGAGEVWLDQGNVVGGETEARTFDTSDVVFELLRHEHGSFEFLASDDAPAGHDPVDVDEVIGNAEAKLAEWRTVEAVVPSLRCWVSVAEDLPADEFTFDRDRWRTLVGIGEGRTVADLDGRLDMGEIAVSKAVKVLADAGIVVVGDIVEPESETFDPTALVIEPALGEGVGGIVMPDGVEPIDLEWADTGGDAIVLDADPGAEDTTLLGAEAILEDVELPDLDQAVRAEIESDPEASTDGFGGGTDVDLDAALDAPHGDHAYLTAAENDTDPAAMPEPLPAAGEPITPVAQDEPVAEAGEADAPVEAEIDVDAEAPVAEADPVEAGTADENVDVTAEAEGLEDHVWDSPPAPSVDVEPDSVEVGLQMAQLSPKAAKALAAAADQAGGPEGPEGKAKKPKGPKPEEPMNRNLLMKFISSK